MEDQKALEARLLAARSKAVKRMPYLASALYAMKMIATPRVPTMAVDEKWRVYWNPAWVSQFPVATLAGIWLHEVSHLLREHPTRFVALNQPYLRGVLWNIAGDATINHALTRERITLPDNGVTLEDVPEGRAGDTVEQLYEKLLASLPPDIDARLAAAKLPVWLREADCGSGASPGRRVWELHEDAEGGISPAQAEIIRAQVESAMNTYRGYLPESMRRFVEERRRAQVDWRKELASLIRKEINTVAGAYDYSYARPSRRSSSSPGVVLPSMRQARPPRITAVIDTSGSMSNRMLALALAEIDGVLREVGPHGGRGIRLVSCDARAGELQEVRSAAEVKLTGGGGTDLREAIVTVASHPERPDLVLILTDGYTPWADEPPVRNARARYVALLVQEYKGKLPSWVDRITINQQPN